MMQRSNRFKILGIESSCDDTGVSIIDQDGKILSNCLNSQVKHHVKHGGILPVVARELHLNNIDKVAQQALQDSGLASFGRDVDAVAVTNRPGLKLSLEIGLNYARALAKKYSKPVLPIHHMQAHALMPLLQNRGVKFPFMALLISGGHALISMVERYNKFYILGKSIDDAPGDLLDKFARRFRVRNLGPPYDTMSGGAAVELLAKQETSNRFKYFTGFRNIPMMASNNCDMSFSGYTGSLDILAANMDTLWDSGDREAIKTELGHMGASLQRAIVLQVVKKIQRAYFFYRMHWRTKHESAFLRSNQHQDHYGFEIRRVDDDGLDLVISGGVAANKYIVDKIATICQESIDESIRVYTPSKDLCSDNGLMIAWNGLLRYKDYLDQQDTFRDDGDINESVVIGGDKLDLLTPQSESPIGQDLWLEMRSRGSFQLSRLRHPELQGPDSFSA